ncbi:MAG: ATP-binding protein [Burkholderiales bacterium]
MQGMFERLAAGRLRELGRRFPAVVILGARQVGKTTLARRTMPGLSYLDCEDPVVAAALREDARFLLQSRSRDGLVIDEAQVVPGVFAALRGLIDEQPRAAGRFVILGSAQPALVQSAAESLAGRAAVLELAALTACEAATGDAPLEWRTVWLKGGFPNALRGDFREWWEAYLRLFLERDLPQYGAGADPILMRRLLTMLAHSQGGLLNASQLGGSLGVSYHTVQRYLDVLERTFIVRRLPPYFRNVGKRLVKAPKVYLRDTGLLHHLLNIGTAEELDNHPIRGASWETFVIEDVLRRESFVHPQSQAFFWRTAAGAEIDLVLDRYDHRVALEVKAGRGDVPRAVRAITDALPDVAARRGWIIDQSTGIDRLGEQIARAGFGAVQNGVPS